MTGSNATAMHTFKIPKQTKGKAVVRLPFEIDADDGGAPETFWLRRPKLALMSNLITLVDQRGAFSVNTFGMRLAAMLSAMIDYVEVEPPFPHTMPNPAYDPEEPDAGVPLLVPHPRAGQLRGQARLLQRLNDPDDDMDIMALEPIFRVLASGAYGQRPIGPSLESSAKPGDGGPDSEADSFELPDETSGI